MIMFRVSATVLAVLTGLSVRSGAQSPSASPAFEVASIKVNRVGGAKGNTRTPVGSGGVLQPRGDRLLAQNATLRTLVRYAYGQENADATAVLSLEDARVAGGPAWIGSDAFDVEAKLPPKSTPRERTLMMRTLLEERFSLKAHRGAREMPVYALVRAGRTDKLGERLRERTGRCVQGADSVTRELIRCGVRMRPGHFFGNDVSLPAVAMYLSQIVDRVVVDRTELRGRYDFEVRYTTPVAGAGQTPATPRVPDPDAPSIFAALQEQLGLKLEPARASIDVLIIDDARRPSAD
jgi:uncharacterized protein (TIGR03435 family)